jgi:UDP-galactopyranose mutase
MSNPPALLVFSHLRWDFVYQRPQHLLSRMAARRRVVIVEEPVYDESADAHWTFATPTPNLRFCRPHTPVGTPGFGDEQMPSLRALARELVDREALGSPVAWFYTPLALPLLDEINPAAVVYDCMDELSAFRGAPPLMVEREKELLGVADVVFTGGPSLYKAKKDRHANAHCFPSSVDAKHFSTARAGVDAPEQAHLPRPRLGFFGVIDERFDADLLGALAAARPDWQICLVGPVVKIDPATLPRAANVHYFGQRSYAELPAFLAGWDVCLLPFARNESTRFISPTKTLEYMAAGKPIVSTPITDVAEPYGTIVRLGDTAEEFIAACDAALNAPADDVERRAAAMAGVLARTSWDSTAAAMEEQIEKVVRKKAAPTAPRADFAPVVVAGAGPTGLSAAYHLGSDALLLEREGRVGGWCRSIQEKGFTFDFAGHIMFSNDPYVHELYKLLLGDNVHWQDREAWVYSKNVYTRYPFQGALYGLPHDVIKECLVGAIEARFGSLKAAPKASAPSLDGHANGNGHAKLNGHANGNGHAHANGNGNGKHATNGNGICANPAVLNDKGDAVTDCCADGVLESSAPLTLADGPPRNFEEFIYKVWGAGIAKHFAVPYNRKIWAVPLDQMETSWLGGRVPLPDLEEMIDGALKPVPKPMGPNARFGYPLHGGFQTLMDGFLPYLKGEVRLNTRVIGVAPSRHELTLGDRSRVRYERFISTMPLPVLVRLMGDEVPREVQEAAAALRYTSVRCVNLGIGRENLTEKHWIYYPEDTVFHRIFVQGNASPHCNAPGGFGLTCEITYSPHKPLPCDGDALIRRCIEDCHKVGIFTPDDPVWVANQVDMPHAYVVYDHARPRNVALIREWMAKHDIILAGRYSEWEYYNSDHAFLAGKKAAERARELSRTAAMA